MAQTSEKKGTGTLTLYCFPRSGNSREVKLVLHEKGIPYAPVNTHAEGFDRDDPAFRRASPGGRVPAIVDGDVCLAEAYRINAYLEDRYPQQPLLPKDPAAREAIAKWVALYDRKLCLKIGLMLIECLLKKKEDQKEEVKARLREEILAGLRELDRELGEKEYFFGAYSLADVSVTPHIAAIGRVQLEIPSECTRLRAWLDRVKARPNFGATLE
jgi:glutathione S-transferase